MEKQDICYLCNRVIDRKAIEKNDQWTRDHLPAKVFHPKALRKQGAFKNLDWLPAHYGCNNAFTEDEEYVARVMSLFVGDQNYMGHALMQ